MTEDWMHGNTKTGTRLRYSLSEMPVTVLVPKDLSNQDLIDYCDSVNAYATTVLERLLGEEEPLLSGMVASYSRLVHDLTELRAMMASRTIGIPSKWIPGVKVVRRGLQVEDAEEMREGWAYALSRTLSQLRLVFEKIPDMPLYNTKRGRHEYWVEGLFRLLSSARSQLNHWAQLWAWEQANQPTEDVEERMMRVIEQARE